MVAVGTLITERPRRTGPSSVTRTSGPT